MSGFSEVVGEDPQAKGIVKKSTGLSKSKSKGI